MNLGSLTCEIERKTYVTHTWIIEDAENVGK